MKPFKALIEEKSISIGVVGLGYVGLPLAAAFAEAGFKVIGFEVAEQKIAALNAGESYISDVSSQRIAQLREQALFEATSDFSKLRECEAISVCVPTPLRKTGDPDLTYILEATRQIRAFLRSGQLVVLESTTYPGTTLEVVAPELSATGLEIGSDVYLAFSPERIDPGNPHYGVENTPKIIGGVSPLCTELASALYRQIVQQIMPVSSPTAAEMVKLLENTFRAVNIGLVNEIAIIADKLKLDVWEIIEAAATKPFGFMPFYPGPGLGGHCIPIDPHYLSWKLRTLNYRTRFIELAEDINSSMPSYVVDKVSCALNLDAKPIRGSKILILGVAYKRNISDWRESPAVPIIEELLERGGEVFYEDQHVPEIRLGDGTLMRSSILEVSKLGDYDSVVIVTDHCYYDVPALLKHATRIIDTRNLTGAYCDSKVVKL